MTYQLAETREARDASQGSLMTWVLTWSTHNIDTCERCFALMGAAVTSARVMGSMGATREEAGTDGIVQHSAKVARGWRIEEGGE